MIAVAVCRTSAPTPRPSRANATGAATAPAVARSGSDPPDQPCPASTLFAASEARQTTVISGTVAATSTVALASSTGSRRGTAAKVARTRPELYSPVTIMIPNTPRTSENRSMPRKAPATSARWECRPVAPASATVSTATEAATTHVERSANSLVHSARTTRAKVTR